MSAPRRAAVVVFAALAAVGCSSVNVKRWRAPDASNRVAAIKTIALMPLLLAGKRRTEGSHNTVGPRWMARYAWTSTIAADQYQPAADVFAVGMKKAFPGRQVIAADVIDVEMRKLDDRERASGLDKPATNARVAAARVARATKADAVLVCELRDFKARAAGLGESARTSARADIALYTVDEKQIWRMQAEIVRGPAGSNDAPTLTQLMEYSTPRLVKEVRAMMGD
ncbi:MAG: hypothetical protein KC503_37115 [Myxococcales bacterium]|nr:hypothetical protein [Myxococcales bacterium]